MTQWDAPGSKPEGEGQQPDSSSPQGTSPESAWPQGGDAPQPPPPAAAPGSWSPTPSTWSASPGSTPDASGPAPVAQPGGTQPGATTPGDPNQPSTWFSSTPQAAATDPAAQAGQPAQPQKKGGLPISGGLLARVGIIGAIVVGGLVFRDRLTGNAGDLRVGDCFDEPADMTEVTEIQHQPCTDPHDGEVMFVGDYPTQDAYPGNDAFDAYAEANCIPAFESYIGRDYETDTEFNIGTFYPVSEGWSDGDHEITCYVFRIDEAKMNASVKGIG